VRHWGRRLRESESGATPEEARAARGAAAATRELLTNSLIRDSGSNGVDRGWTGDSVDYLATNTFQRIRYCAQTLNRNGTGQCPTSPSCPSAPLAPAGSLTLRAGPRE
jgi:hypothetical protein